jgi:hypothetical protein
MKWKLLLAVTPIVLLIGCASLNVGETPRQALDFFCRLKSSSLATLLIRPDLQAAAKLLCGFIGDPVGTPG